MHDRIAEPYLATAELLDKIAKGGCCCKLAYSLVPLTSGTAVISFDDGDGYKSVNLEVAAKTGTYWESRCKFRCGAPVTVTVKFPSGRVMTWDLHASIPCGRCE